MNVFWTTIDGRKIEIRWMQTKHLVNAFNKIIRDNGFDRRKVELRVSTRSTRKVPPDTLDAMYAELRVRGVYNWIHGLSQLHVPSIREKPVELCMLRALLDNDVDENFVDKFMGDPEGMTATILRDGLRYPNVIAKFAEYRMEGRC